jgi:putative PIN family toxin of toxin-antitoxin system
LRAVLDTSVLVAAFLHPAGVNGRVLALAGERYELCLSTGILAEVQKVLSYPWLRRYGYSEEEVEEFLWALREAAFLVRRWPKIQIVSKDEHLQKIRNIRELRFSLRRIPGSYPSAWKGFNERMNKRNVC